MRLQATPSTGLKFHIFQSVLAASSCQPKFRRQKPMPAHLTSLKVDASRLHFTYSSVEAVHCAIAGNAAKLDDSLDATGLLLKHPRYD